MCDGENLVCTMRLTPTPPGNRLLSEAELSQPETTYPLDVYFCRDCHHVQLGHVVDPRILYQKQYLYVSGTSAHFVKHLDQYAEEMIARYQLPRGSFVVDIGSNDGTCLRGFQTRGMDVLGVDPATEIARAATESGIPTVGTFFSFEVAKELRAKHGPATFITSHNVCAHIDQLDDVMRGVAHWLDDDGVFGVEIGYFVDVYSKLYFDTIYHEHLDYHTVGPFRRLMARTGMEILSAKRVSPQGGSIRLLAQKTGGPRKPDGTVEQLVALEHEMALDKPESITAYGERIAALGEQLRALLGELKAAGKRIGAYGAPTKAVTFLSHFGIGRDTVEFVVEDNAMKHGKYLPVSHIPVVATEELYRRQPDYALILAWNFAEPIMAMHRKYAEQGGHFVVPLPEPRIA